MNKQIFTIYLACFFLTLSGCGQSGGLYLPTEKTNPSLNNFNNGSINYDN